jgi:hypothetical protein
MNRGAGRGYFHDETVHIAGYLIEGFGGLDMYVVVIVKRMFRHHRFLGLSQPDTQVVVCHPGLN